MPVLSLFRHLPHLEVHLQDMYNENNILRDNVLLHLDIDIARKLSKTVSYSWETGARNDESFGIKLPKDLLSLLSESNKEPWYVFFS